MSKKRTKASLYKQAGRVAISCLLSVAMMFSGITPQAIAEGIEELTQEVTTEVAAAQRSR